MRRTKIVCTIGPASEKRTVLKKMIQAGMDVARLNFSHGTYEEQQIPVTYGGFTRDVKAGDRIMIDDGNVVCRVTSTHQGAVAARVEVGGLVTSNKGINLPDSSVRLSALTAKDQKDVPFGVRAGVDMIVLSFVSSAEDIRKLRELIKREEKRQDVKAGHIHIVAKMERADAMRRMDEIIEEADAVMVGRG